MKKEEREKLLFMDSSLDLEKRVEDLLGRLTFDEKCKLSSGRWTLFHTKPIRRLGIKPFKMIDGPHGIGGGGALIALLKKATYFPTAICRCATWNPELSENFGKALAQELRAIGQHMLLAPGINIDRTPLCGRTFEYQTEDPYLNKKIAVAVVKGVQSQRIAVCAKHFVCNNQEYNRFTVSSEVSERALQEIYLPAFEAIVREADAWSIMACYNKINGLYGCEHKNLLRERLIDDWGFRGFVVSDWTATKKITNPEGCVNAGLSLEMPRPHVYKKQKLEQALEKGKFTEAIFNDNVRRLLRVMFLVGLFDDENTLPSGGRNTPEQQAIVRKIAEEGIVLLKNSKNLLPLNIEKIKSLAVLGANAKKKMAWGGGSSMVRAFYEVTPLKGLKNKCEGKVEIISSAAEADAAVLFVGLNHRKGNDSENHDRTKLELPERQIELINQTAKENENTVVVLINGSPVAMDGWIENVSAVVEAWYAGSEGGNAIADILFGDVNPSGKLPLTFPKKLSDSPAHKSPQTYPGDEKVYYEEGIFVGYRHFDQHDIEPLFPFGHGLSYTTFIYENLQISKSQVSKNDTISVSVDILNAGDRAGAEVVQLYIQDVESSVERPPKELKGFKKIPLNPGEKQTVTFELHKEDLSFYDENENRWKAEKGIFKILLGSSSRDIRLQDEIKYLG
ncbi:MAG: glycoside hydrolase family 3 C-terminal domain-containing protein [Candidatus Helarchaeota archaeon]|nr:glycoside hydrolase family 3 C-terminal domain-containing protein [Candidatus Helarchaeota archaeon]